jgi:hypothetical protein
MKKLILLIFFLMLSIASFSQETFVKKYTSAISKINGVLGDWKTVSITVVFNEKNTDDIVFYYLDGSIKRFHKIGNVETNKTYSGDEFQIIECIESEEGYKAAIEYFNDDTLRVLLGNDTFVELHKD